MNDIYFVDQEHEKNFIIALSRWDLALRDAEYMTACYILAVPMIFHKIRDFLCEFDHPASWILRYLNWSEEYNEEWEIYSKYHDDDKLHHDYEAWIKRKPYDLSSGMVSLGKFALNMWNAYPKFNLMYCMDRLDEENLNVLMCGINMRIGKFL